MKLRLSRKSAKKLGLSRTVGKASLGLSRPGMNHLTAALSRHAKRKLKRARAIRFSVVVVATDASGNRTVARRSVMVRG